MIQRIWKAGNGRNKGMLAGNDKRDKMRGAVKTRGSRYGGERGVDGDTQVPGVCCR
jgi:hypothetical protein